MKPSFIWRFTLKLSNTENAIVNISIYLLSLWLQKARHAVLNHHSTYSDSGIGSIECTFSVFFVFWSSVFFHKFDSDFMTVHEERSHPQCSCGGMKQVKTENALPYAALCLSSLKIAGAQRTSRSPSLTQSRGVAYTLFQNDRHFSIPLFPCKLALLASLSNLKLKRNLTCNGAKKANLHFNRRILKWRPFWNKVYNFP